MEIGKYKKRSFTSISQIGNVGQEFEIIQLAYSNHFTDHILVRQIVLVGKEEWS